MLLLQRSGLALEQANWFADIDPIHHTCKRPVFCRIKGTNTQESVFAALHYNQGDASGSTNHFYVSQAGNLLQKGGMTSGDTISVQMYSDFTMQVTPSARESPRKLCAPVDNNMRAKPACDPDWLLNLDDHANTSWRHTGCLSCMSP